MTDKISKKDGVTREEKKLKLLKNLEIIRNWDPCAQTVLDLKHPYIEAENLAIELRDQDSINKVTEYSRLYTNHVTCIDGPEVHGNDIDVLLGTDNKIIATDYNGYCLLLYDIDDWGNTTGSGLYVIRSIADVYEVLEEKSYREHMAEE